MLMIRVKVVTRPRRRRKSKTEPRGKHSSTTRIKLQRGVGIRFARETVGSVHAVESFNLSEHPIIHKHKTIFFVLSKNCRLAFP